MTNWDVVLISYRSNQVVEMTVRGAPDMESAAIAALEDAPNQVYDHVIIKPVYLN
jgi:hypothetical protein